MGRMLAMDRVVFQLIDAEREDAEHRFYVDQAKKRLLSQFDNISAEAGQAEQEYWEEGGRSFNPDFDDEGSLAQSAKQGSECTLIARGLWKADSDPCFGANRVKCFRGKVR